MCAVSVLSNLLRATASVMDLNTYSTAPGTTLKPYRPASPRKVQSPRQVIFLDLRATGQDLEFEGKLLI